VKYTREQGVGAVVNSRPVAEPSELNSIAQDDGLPHIPIGCYLVARKDGLCKVVSQSPTAADSDSAT
jgi:hypothetical protein